MMFAFTYYGAVSDKAPIIAVFLLVIGILWWLKVVPAIREKVQPEESAKRYEADSHHGTAPKGDERLLHARSFRLEPGTERSELLSENGEVIGTMIGTHETGRIWIIAVDSCEAPVLHLRCKNPGAWWHYGYKRRVRWLVTEATGERQIGIVELRPTFLGRFRWRIETETDPEFGQVKAGVEWSRLAVGLGGATTAMLPSLGHHATVFMRSRPVCALSWSGRSAALTFGPEKWEPVERKLALATVALVALCPNYYKHA
ncbi:MAG: hypothetical protein WBL72_02605 [Thermoguttaceae bacterium]